MVCGCGLAGAGHGRNGRMTDGRRRLAAIFIYAPTQNQRQAPATTSFDPGAPTKHQNKACMPKKSYGTCTQLAQIYLFISRRILIIRDLQIPRSKFSFTVAGLKKRSANRLNNTRRESSKEDPTRPVKLHHWSYRCFYLWYL